MMLENDHAMFCFILALLFLEKGIFMCYVLFHHAFVITASIFTMGLVYTTDMFVYAKPVWLCICTTFGVFRTRNILINNLGILVMMLL